MNNIDIWEVAGITVLAIAWFFIYWIGAAILL
jgi:hypothetical protein